MPKEDSSACMSERDIIYTQRALIAAKTGRDVKSPAVQRAADILLRLAPLFVEQDPEWIGTLQIPFRPGVMGRIEKLVPVSYDEGLDKP
jgi:hypothetical protein